jgi:hypothetical protein
MAAYVKYECFVENLAEQVHDLSSDTLKVALSNTAPTVGTDTVFGDITEIAAGAGYSAGGAQASQSSSAQAAGTYKLVIGDVTFTAAAGTIGPFRYVILYNDTPSSPLKPLIASWDYGVEISITDGNSFTTDFSAVNGVLTLA